MSESTIVDHPATRITAVAGREAENYEQRRFQRDRRGRKLHAREQALVDRFLRSLPPGSVILDVPCGMGRFTELILERGHRAISVDLSLDQARLASTRGDARPSATVCADVRQLPLVNNAVDATICIRLLHHLEPPLIVTVLAELRRVSSQAFVTFYDRRSIKFLKKRVRGKRLSGRYVSATHLGEMSRQAGWPAWRRESAFNPFETLHCIRLNQ